MPIPVSKLRELQLPLEERILTFLSSDPTNAYSSHEILEKVVGLTPVEFAGLTAERAKEIVQELSGALKRLRDAKKIDFVKHKELIYVHLLQTGVDLDVVGT